MTTVKHTGRFGKPGRGFTLVEMMVVVGIIVILVTMLVPAVNAARTSAKVTSTRVLINALDTGLNSFKGEIRLGRDYPPSRAKPDESLPAPYDKGEYCCGAQTLVWALAGPNLGGTPGFTGDVLSLPSTRGPYGPFVDTSKIKMKKLWEVVAGFPDGDEVCHDPFVFVDDFNKAIAYFKAPYLYPGGTEDNVAILWGSKLADPPTNFFDKTNKNNPNSFIRDRRVDYDPTPGAGYEPHNRDSFLLISPGPDLKYGTSDDVANFPVPGQ